MSSSSPDFFTARSSRRRYWLFVAVLGSMVVHLSLWFWFQMTHLPYSAMPSEEKLALRKFKLERVEINPKWMEPKLATPEQVSPLPSPDRAALAPTEEKRTFAKLLDQSPSAPTVPAGAPPIPQDKPVVALGETGNPTLDLSTHSALESELQSTREQEFKKSSKSVAAGRPILNTPGAPVAPKPGATELAPPSQPKIGPNQGPTVGEGGPTFVGSSRLDDFFGPGGLPPPAATPKMPDAATQVPQSLIKDKPVTTQKFDSLNPFLNVELFTQERTGSTGTREGYYLVRITAKPNQHLAIVPKDVFFLLDISSSIGGKRLKTFTGTLLNTIAQLNPKDRFKIMVFRNKLTYFREDWTAAGKIPTAELTEWVSALHTGGVTDFYDGLRPLTEYSREPGRMALGIVMSDGVPTSGELDSTQIISEFSQANAGRVSIFSLSNGKDVNNFLLDLLSYCNQGRLRHAAEIEKSEPSFQEFVSQVKSPLFLDPRFKIAGVDGEQAYPQNLPNLYQDLPLLIFGRYAPGKSTTISLQVLGESINSTKELLVQLPIPKVPNGPEVLPATWARQRIYHLLGRMTRSRVSQDSILEEVRKLSEEYQVEVPYF